MGGNFKIRTFNITFITRNRMQNPIFKIINADLAYSINMYTNIKKKLLTCNADPLYEQCFLFNIFVNPLDDGLI
jgi:hypothetical protein